VFVLGGFGPTAEPMATVEVYDPSTNTWELRAPLPVPTHHAAAAVVGNRLFIVGGFTGGRVSWTPLADVYEYDAARNSWTPRDPLPAARGGLAVAALGGRLHALGGAADRPTNEHDVYDPVADRWSIANAMPTARDHLAAVVVDQRIWAIGGRQSFFGQQYPNVEIYDASTDSWQTGAPLPTGRGGIAGAVLGDRVYVFGGEAPLRIFGATEMYDRTSGEWIAKAPMPTPRHGIGAAVLGGLIYVVAGGTEPGFAASGANEAYAP
jgi:N-acetylneuraminic acid mutarotase